MANITPEVIKALRTLRMHVKFYADINSEFNVLDNAGVFSAIDAVECSCPQGWKYHANNCVEYPGQEQRPAPKQVSKCTCPDELGSLHRKSCPEYPEAPASKCTCHPLPDARSEHKWGCPGDPTAADNILSTIGLKF